MQHTTIFNTNARYFVHIWLLLWILLFLTISFVYLTGVKADTSITPHYDTYDMEHLDFFSKPEIVQEFENVIIFEDLDHSHNAMNLRNSTYEELAKIPEPIRKQFITDGWYLYIGDTQLAEDQLDYDYSILGIANYDKKYIAAHDLTKLLHEFGHYYEYAIDCFDEFETYYETDKDAMYIVSTYAAKNANEFFASVFTCYIHDKIGFKDYILEDTRGTIDTTWNFFCECDARNWI